MCSSDLFPSHDKEGEWEEKVYNPSVILDGSTYKMWYDGGDAVGYATSADGITWEKHEEPVLTGSAGAWDEGGVSSSTVILEGETYKMWYSGIGASDYAIGYATSADGITWEKHEEPVLEKEGEWDEYGVFGPSVLYNGEEYEMWYSGIGASDYAIGYATSADGIVWEKHEGPVLEKEGGWVS